MLENFQTCLDEVLKLEGGLSDDPRDAGGITNLGVTLPALQHWFGSRRVATAQDIRDLTPTTVEPIYRQGFWRAIHADLLPRGVDLAVFDWAVNSGPGRAIRGLQAALGVSQDGLVGPITLNAATAADPAALIDKINDLRVDYLTGLDNFDAFGHGWLNRVKTVGEVAKTMLA